MSRRVTLYIGGERADLSEVSPILFNWTREELDNPTIVRNSYTHPLVLPATPANNAIFGHFHRLDRRTDLTPGVDIGVGFNPLKRASFTLYYDDMTVAARGYVKLDEIQLRGDQAYSYSCTLYGGLGSLFFSLDEKDDGQKRTLADLIYKDLNDADVEPENETMPVTRANVAVLYGASLLDPIPSWSNIVSFAPFYNGVPEGDFDANKGIIRPADSFNFPAPVTVGGTSYNLMTGMNTELVTFASKHTEWEMRDFRCYLQRPIVSVKAVLTALTDAQNTGDWTLVLDGAFFTAGTNPWYDDAWMTLPMLKLGEGQTWATLTLADALRGTCSPAAFLIGYAKMFGLVFDVDESTQTVTLMTRDDYYTSRPLHDLTDRIDRKTIDIVPVNASARWYEMKATQVNGEYTTEYADTYGRVYGSQRIDTGWEFDSAVKDLLPSFPFKGAADVLETSPLYYGTFYNSQQGFAAVDVENVTYKLYDGSGEAKDIEAYQGIYLSKTTTYYNAADNGFDAFPKVQLHAADNKASDGSGVLVFNCGTVSLPTSGGLSWAVTEDHADMATLNEGRPCWYLYGVGLGGTSVSSVPCYRRMPGAQTMDFGAPREIAIPGESTSEAASVYYNRWRGYLADRLDVDTKVMSAKVNLKGLQPGASLLRDFFRFRNTLWSLNKIKDYAPSEDGLTQCEFVQVKDKNAYDSSQDVPAMESYYLNLTPASLDFIAAGESKTVSVSSNVSWSISTPAWITASPASGTDNATVTFTASENTGSARTGTISATGTHSTSASVSASQDTSFVPSISINKTSSSVDAQARTFYYQITCNGAWAITSNTSGGWLTCTSSGNGNGTATVGIAANPNASSRTGILTFSMTDYPLEKVTLTITQAAQAATTTYALELGAASKAFGVSGGSYTLTAQGVTYTNGVESSRVTLSASDIDFAKSGSSAISRSGLVFSAADLGDTNTSAQTAIYTLTWRANSSTASFTVTQAANSVSWALSLGASSYTFAVTGGTYTLAVTGVKTKNGTTTTSSLTASDLTITKSGSSAISRSGLVFSASDLGDSTTSEQTAVFSLTWAAHSSATGTFTAKQSANSVAYSLTLGANSYTFSQSGGTYTLSVTGVEVRNGVTTTTTLSASDLTIVKSGSEALTRSGLTFSASDLGDTNTSQTTATWAITWDDHSGATASFVTKQAANVVTWALVLGASTYELPASGGSYTLSVTGKKVKNGTTTTTSLAGSDLTITRSGSTAVSNSGLVFSAVDLTYNETTGTTSTFAIVWTAHSSATATFTATQEANTYTVIQDESSWRMPDMPDDIVWNTSGTTVAAANGDTAPLDTRADEIVDEKRSYTSGHVYTIQTTVHNTATFVASGTGFSIQSGNLRASKNSTRFARFGTLTATASGMFSDMEMTWSLEQAGQS